MVSKVPVRGTRFIVICIIAALLGTLSMACDEGSVTLGDNPHTASEAFSYSVEIGSQTRLEMDAISGSIEIEGMPDLDSVTLRGERIVRSTKSEADAAEYLEKLVVEVADKGSSIMVKTTEPTGSHSGRDFSVEYRVQVPADWHIVVDQINGSVNVSSISQSVSVDVVNGEVAIESSSADIEVDVTNGRLRLTGIYGNVDAATNNGSIESRVQLPPAGECKLETKNGRIDLAIPESTSAEFRAEVTNGGIDVSGLTIEDQDSSSRRIVGTLGEGDGIIELRTVNGQISVKAIAEE